MKAKHVLTMAAFMAASALAYGQNTPPSQTPPTPKPGQSDITAQQTKNMEEMKKIQLERCSKIISTNVKNNAGESLGEIKDLALDAGRGRVGYVVVGFGGVM